jgi:heterodisulfide reductase subunit C
MEISPTRMMRLLQLEAALAGDKQQGSVYARQALGCDTCWLCAGCLACTTRCPQGVDIAGTMDVLRQEGLRRGLASTSKRARDIQALHRTFLSGALKRGRIHELFLMMGYKLRTGHWFADAQFGPAMVLKGKLHILPGESPGNDRVREAISRLKQQGADRK